MKTIADPESCVGRRGCGSALRRLLVIRKLPGGNLVGFVVLWTVRSFSPSEKCAPRE